MEERGELRLRNAGTQGLGASRNMEKNEWY